VAWSTSPSSAPPSTRAIFFAGSTCTPRINDRSISSPPSHTALPAMLWPPPRTATSSPCCLANFTHSTTSSVDRQRAISAGLRSIMAFQIARTLSNSGESAVRISPLIALASSFATEGSSVVLEPANVLKVRPDMGPPWERAGRGPRRRRVLAIPAN
jgi:hypothetical protein